MKFTLLELVEKYNSFKTMSDKKVPIKISYAISKNITAFANEVNIIDDNRIKLAKTYAEKDEEGNPKIVDNNFVINDMKEFSKELNEYYGSEIELDICTFNADELDKLDDPRYDIFSPSELSAIQFMIE